MYPSNWSNDLTHRQFVGSSIMLSWDLTPDDSEVWSPCPLGVKARLGFTEPLPTTTMLIAYAQYHNLVFIDFYHKITFDYNAWCMAGSFKRLWWRNPWSPGLSGQHLHQGLMFRGNGLLMVLFPCFYTLYQWHVLALTGNPLFPIHTTDFVPLALCIAWHIFTW